MGSGRSGTTLLRAIFDSHPDLAIPDEVSFVIRLSRPHYARRYGWHRRFDAEPCLDLLLANGSLQRWQLPDDEIRSALLSPQAASSFAEAVRRLYRLWAAHQGKPRYGDKTPMHVLYLPRLARMFPEARFVHLVRDGRDVALSYRTTSWGPAGIEDAAVEWRRRVARGRRAGARLGPDRYLEVRYEDLVAEPEPFVRRLCEFIDLRWDDGLLRYYERAGDVIAATRFPEAHQRLLLPPTVGLRDWRRDMEPADVARFEAIGGRLLAELGYEVTTPPANGLDRLRADAKVAAAFASRSWSSAIGGGRVLVGR
ncbi:MAG: sulfotransferase family protein [Acidimicrobiales bacterium]